MDEFEKALSKSLDDNYGDLGGAFAAAEDSFCKGARWAREWFENDFKFHECIKSEMTIQEQLTEIIKLRGALESYHEYFTAIERGEYEKNRRTKPLRTFEEVLQLKAKQALKQTTSTVRKAEPASPSGDNLTEREETGDSPVKPKTHYEGNRVFVDKKEALEYHKDAIAKLIETGGDYEG